jgi:predicted aldo/keto reductase-like oxidoreductase
MMRIVIGDTGLDVARLGFGGIPIQTVSESKAIETVLHAVESGVDFIDTSRAYTTSEQRIGMALRQTNKHVTLASKSHARTSEGIRADLAKSLEELQVDHIDLYQCHYVKNVDDYNQVISRGGALQGLLKSKEEGLISHIGLTSHSLDLLDQVLDDMLFETIMVCFSFLEPAARERIIPKALKQKIGVIAMKPFSGGVIENTTLALKYALSQEGIVILAGVERTDHFDENWEIFNGSHGLDEDDKKEIEEIRRHHEKNFCRRCDYCQPCTEEIPIQLILGVRSMVKRMGMDFLKKEVLAQGIQKARQCSECGECMTRCPYELSIPSLIQENLIWLDEHSKSS